MGKIVVTIVGCDNLANQDTFSKTDSYVKINLGSKSMRTATVDNQLSPRFNETFSLFAGDSAGTDTLKLEVFQAGMFSDKCFDRCDLRLGGLPRNKEATLTLRWHSNPSSTVTLKVKVELTDAPEGQCPDPSDAPAGMAFGGGCGGAAGAPLAMSTSFVAPSAGGFGPSQSASFMPAPRPIAPAVAFVPPPPPVAVAPMPQLGGVYGGANSHNGPPAGGLLSGAPPAAGFNNPYGANPYDNNPYAAVPAPGSFGVAPPAAYGASGVYGNATGGGGAAGGGVDIMSSLGLGALGAGGGYGAGVSAAGGYSGAATTSYGAPPATATSSYSYTYGATNAAPATAPPKKFDTGYPG